MSLLQCVVYVCIEFCVHVWFIMQCNCYLFVWWFLSNVSCIFLVSISKHVNINQTIRSKQLHKIAFERSKIYAGMLFQSLSSVCVCVIHTICSISNIRFFLFCEQSDNTNISSGVTFSSHHFRDHLRYHDHLRFLYRHILILRQHVLCHLCSVGVCFGYHCWAVVVLLLVSLFRSLLHHLGDILVVLDSGILCFVQSSSSLVVMSWWTFFLVDLMLTEALLVTFSLLAMWCTIHSEMPIVAPLGSIGVLWLL